MVFEIIRKRDVGWGIKPNEVSIAKKCVSFGADIVAFFKGKEFIEVYLDRENKRVGFKTTEDFSTGFKLRTHKTSSYITSKVLSESVVKGKYTAKIEGEFVVISVSEIAKNTEEIRLK